MTHMKMKHMKMKHMNQKNKRTKTEPNLDGAEFEIKQ